MSGSAAVGIIALGSLHVVFMLWFAVWWAERDSTDTDMQIHDLDMQMDDEDPQEER